VFIVLEDDENSKSINQSQPTGRIQAVLISTMSTSGLGVVALLMLVSIPSDQNIGIEQNLTNAAAYFTVNWQRVSPENLRSDQKHVFLDLVLSRNESLVSSVPSLTQHHPGSGAFFHDLDHNKTSDPTPLWIVPAVANIIQDAIIKAENDSSSIAITFVLPAASGYVVRSDFPERRLEGVASIAQVVSFLAPRQAVTAPSVTGTTANDLRSFISSAAGVVVLGGEQKTGVSQLESLRALDAKLINRLSFPWVVSTPIPETRLVWVEGRKNANVSQRVYEAALALGIRLVVIDKPGHWLQSDSGPYAHFREAFIPVNIDVDGGFAERIVEAVRGYGKPVDGIITISDARLISVAKACEILGYPTSPSAAYTLAGDKFQTRMMELDPNGAFRVFSRLQRIMYIERRELTFPLIVKPCLGWGSQAVTKVSNTQQLLDAVEKAANCHKSNPQQRTDVVIEPYIDGPEVDANFVLLNGEILFFELVDDFPSVGDANENEKDNFVETAMVLPSALPPSKLTAIRDSLYKSILRQGFHTGVFHCEARVQHSSVEYRVDGDGIEDLHPKVTRAEKVRVYLLEINARPEGYYASVPSHYAYGVDYYAQRILFSLGDEVRFRALAHPFVEVPKATFAVLLLQEDEPGIMKTEDTAAAVLQQHPELAPHGPISSTMIKKGDRVAGRKSPDVAFIAWFLVAAETRQKCLDLAKTVQSSFAGSYELE
jgi:biotin carboxylase